METLQNPEIFETRFKVRTYECDLYEHVNNAVYLNYLEYARMEALEQKDLNLDKLKKLGFLVVVKKVEIEYKRPARAGDYLCIRTYLKNYRVSSGTFRQEIFREPDNTPIAEAEVTWVFTNLEGKPIPIPEVVRTAFHIPNSRK